jgi:hypothetical protein
MTGRRIAEVTLLLSDVGIANIGYEARVGRPAPGVRFACFAEAQMTIYGKADLVCVGVVLAVVFPPADRTQGK